MSKGLQTIVTPQGETLVVLPLSDYERLMDQADVASAASVVRNIAAGRDEMVPVEFVERIIAGASPLRAWRELRGLSGKELAERAGLSAAYISEMETGKKDGSISAIKRIAEILKVDIDDLI